MKSTANQMILCYRFHSHTPSLTLSPHTPSLTLPPSLPPSHSLPPSLPHTPSLTLPPHTPSLTLPPSLPPSPSLPLIPHTDYAPISFEGSGRAEFSLGYSFFYDLALHSDLSTPGLVSERRRRETEPTVLPTEEEVLVVVRISFRPKQSGTGLLLYSETPNSYHILQVGNTYNVLTLLAVIEDSFAVARHTIQDAI